MKNSFFKFFIAVFVMCSLFALTACGGGGSSSDPVPTTANVKIAVPGELFNQQTLSTRAVKLADKLIIRAVAYNKGSQVSGIQNIDVEATYGNNDSYMAEVRGLNTSFDYRFSAIYNNIQILNNHIGNSNITNGASFEVNIRTSLKALAYDAWVAKNPTDKSFKNFVQKAAEADYKTDSDFEKVYPYVDYQTSLSTIAKGQQASLPKASDVDISKIQTSGSSSGDEPKEMVFELTSDEGNVVSDNLYKINPSFTIRYSGRQIEESENKAKIENSIVVTDLASDKVVKTWKDDGTIGISFSENLAYNTQYTLSMSDVSDINGYKVISFKAISFTTVKEVIEINNSLSFSLPDGASLEVINCPTGAFNMGSLETELGRSENENQHLVHITKDFYIGKYEVTQAQYKALMGKYPSKYSQDTSKPAYTISYEDAKEYCKALNTRFANSLPNGYTFDLPTEAQWEYACRAGTSTSLNSGKNITTSDAECQNLNEVGWYAKNSDDTAHPVGQKKPNKWGIYDMHGNVNEWCNDWYGDDYDNDNQGQEGYLSNDPKGPKTGTLRVVKGGCYYSLPEDCRSARRLGLPPTINDNQFLGFRVALVPIQ